MSKINEAEAAALARVEYLEMALEALSFIWNAVPQCPQDAYEELRRALLAKKSLAYEILFMWGTVTLNEETRRRAKELAMRRFLREGRSIMYLLDERGWSPGSWLSDDEKQFRDEIATLMEGE
jgi:hypothetical protein